MFGFELIAALVFMVIASAICLIAMHVPLSLAPHFWAGPGAFPFILGAIILFLSSFWVYDVLRNRRRHMVARDHFGEPLAWVEELFGPPDRRRRLYIISGLTLIFVFVLIPVFGAVSHEYGFMGATLLFTLTSLKLFTPMASKYVAVVSLATAVAVYYIFTYGLSLPMPW